MNLNSSVQSLLKVIVLLFYLWKRKEKTKSASCMESPLNLKNHKVKVIS